MSEVPAQTAAPVDPVRYTFPARLFHWLMAGGYFFLWACGFAMTRLFPEDSPLETVLFGLHISVGVTLLFLLLARFAVRLLNTPPPMPPGFSDVERRAAVVGHAGLYLLPALVIGIGWAGTDLGGHHVSWFGLDLPKILPTVEIWAGMEVEEVTETLHKWLAYAMLGLAIIHIAAVAKHRWIDGHDVWPRMAFGKPKHGNAVAADKK